MTLNSVKLLPKPQLFSFPPLNRQVWILAAGRFLLEVGTGFTLFYAPIFFVNQVFLSATQVGIALGSASISGVVGRILGGVFADSTFWGRRRTLLLSAAISAVASFALATTSNFSSLVAGNLLMGLGMGFYWPATEAVVADLTEGEHRKEAYALARLADNLGLGTGIILGGGLIATTGAYRALFLIDGLSFLVFFGVVYFAIEQTYQPKAINSHGQSPFDGWITALSDRRLSVFVVVNVIFTTYISQLHSTMPLYFNKYISIANSTGFSTSTISALFTWHMILTILCLMPIARILKRFSQPKALSISALLWAVGFCLLWVTGVASSWPLLWAILAMGVFAIAIVSYTPFASSLVADLAPPDLRGVYLSINSLCWAVGYAIGPPLGGWAMDRNIAVVYSFWLSLAVSVLITLGILQYLNRILVSEKPPS
ncbi:MAG TPA: MFS transporter [Leptolyngbyaceae cyanobacterium]